MTRVVLVMLFWVVGGIITKNTGPETALAMMLTFFAGMVATISTGDK